MAIVISEGKQSYIDDAGNPLSGGKLYTYAAGTTTPKTTWADSAQTAPNTNPIILNARGEATVFWNGAYKVELRTAADVVIWTVDNVTAVNDPISSATLAASGGSSLVGFLQSGTGAVARTAQAKMRESYSVKDFGATGDGVTDDTTAIQTAITAALANGRSLFLPVGSYAVTELTIPITAGAASAFFNFFGEGRTASKLVKIGASASPVIALTTAVQPQTCNVDISHMAIIGNAKNCDGIRNTALACVTLSQMFFSALNTAVDWLGAIDNQVENCFISGCNYGLKARANGSLSAYSNANTVRDCKIDDNTIFAVDYGQGSNIRFLQCDIERNGTAGNTATGGFMFRNTMDDEIGYAIAMIDGCWLEGNKGWSIQCEAFGSTSFMLGISNTNILSSESGRVFYCGAGGIIAMRNVQAPSPGDTINATCEKLTLDNVLFDVLSGTQNTLLVSQTVIGSAPIEGTHQRNIVVGGGYGVRFSSSAGANVWDFSLDAATGDVRLRPIAGTTGNAAIDANLVLAASRRISINGLQVVGPRDTGWAGMTGTATKGGGATGTITLPQLAERVKALIDALIASGAIGA